MTAADILKTGASELGFELSAEQIELFMIYLTQINLWNERINLTALRSDQDIVIKHFIDSITPAKLIKENSSLLDIGSGAGFPGAALKIVRPDLKVTLLESSGKKVSFLKELIRKLGLEGLSAVLTRAEEPGNGLSRKSFDCVITRAVGSVPHVLQLSLPYVKKGGHVLLMRGRNSAMEQDQAETHADLKLVEENQLTLPFTGDERTLLLFKSGFG